MRLEQEKVQGGSEPLIEFLFALIPPCDAFVRDADEFIRPVIEPLTYAVDEFI
jgi:hypothetical protein